MMVEIKKRIEHVLKEVGVTSVIELSLPPTSDMGDFAFSCFLLAKDQKKNPADVARDMESKIKNQKSKIIDDVKAFGPYVNFFINGAELAKIVLDYVDEQFGTSDLGKGKTILVEYGCPNPMKAFHLGHLKNLITGEAVCRVLENVGYDVIRMNYQGDVGMHIGKSLWGIVDWFPEFEAMRSAALTVRVEFLGKAYAHGATHFEAGPEEAKEVTEYTNAVYRGTDEKIMSVYREARQWSLDYFETIYAKLGVKFDEYYFESETVDRGVALVKEFQAKDIYRESEGAVIFPGSAYDLHDRVFLNSQGFPTYEAKELALSEMRWTRHQDAERLIHVVGKEQSEYFRVLFAAMKVMGVPGGEKESHLAGGFLQLKGDQKMSSRKGNVITGDALLSLVETRVGEIMGGRDVLEKEVVVRRVSVAALNYAMLRSGVSDDIAFDLEQSIAVEGDSGPYLLYIVARINSILKKSKIISHKSKINVPTEIVSEEKQLLLALAEFPEAAKQAAETLDPSYVAHYLFGLAQAFNTFYQRCQVLQVDETLQAFRLDVVRAVAQTMTRGLYLLGIETVEEM